MDVEKRMRSTNFARFSKVQGSLLQQLMTNCELQMDDLDMVSAAGRGQSQLKKVNTSDSSR